MDKIKFPTPEKIDSCVTTLATIAGIATLALVIYYAFIKGIDAFL